MPLSKLGKSKGDVNLSLASSSQAPQFCFPFDYVSQNAVIEEMEVVAFMGIANGKPLQIILIFHNVIRLSQGSGLRFSKGDYSRDRRPAKWASMINLRCKKS
jgi:hypothetical protein